MQLVFDTPVPTHPVQELRRFQYLTADDGHFLDRAQLARASLTPAPQPADLGNRLPAVLVGQIRSQFARRYRP
jgi:hypothetical protein